MLFKLRDRIGTGIPVTGLDFCEPMLKEARAKRAAKASYSDITFEFGDCMDLPLDDNSVDAVTISFGVRNFEKSTARVERNSPRAPPWRQSFRLRILAARQMVQPNLLFLS